MQLPIGPRFPNGLPISHKSFLVRFFFFGRPTKLQMHHGVPAGDCGGFWPFKEISRTKEALLRRSAVPAVG